MATAKIQIRKALQRWKGPVTDHQAICKDENHPLHEQTLSMTKQSLKDETMMKTILKRARQGVIEHVNQYEGRYGDATAQDLMQSMELVRETEKWFEKLPLEAKKEFNQDPVAAIELLDKIQLGDKAAIELGQKLGMLEPPRPGKEAVVPPQPVKEVTPEPPPA